MKKKNRPFRSVATKGTIPKRFNKEFLHVDICSCQLIQTCFPVWPRNRLIFAGLEPFLIHTEKACIASYYRQFSMNDKIKILK